MADSLEFILGQMDGRLAGISSEIKDIKEMMKCESEDCETCKKEIDSKFKEHGSDISTLKEKSKGDIAVRKWSDSIWVKAGVVSAIVFSLIATLRG